jgi:hypothetical protein
MILDDAGFGYDPTIEEPFEVIRPQFVDTLSAAVAVNPAFLPPVGRQGKSSNAGYPGTCTAWSTSYGLATFTAARAGLVNPALPTGQASPALIYIQVLKEHGATAATCGDSAVKPYFSILKNGTASMADAPYVPDCVTLWQAYADATIASNASFAMASVKGIATSDLDHVKQVLASGRALAYGTRLFTDWDTYQGDPLPYWGNSTVLMRKESDKPPLHADRWLRRHARRTAHPEQPRHRLGYRRLCLDGLQHLSFSTSLRVPHISCPTEQMRAAGPLVPTGIPVSSKGISPVAARAQHYQCWKWRSPSPRTGNRQCRQPPRRRSLKRLVSRIMLDRGDSAGRLPSIRIRRAIGVVNTRPSSKPD